MEKPRTGSYVTVIVLLAVTSLALLFIGEVRTFPDPAIGADLPDVVGEWTGSRVLYCIDEQCFGAFLAGNLADPDTCPDCGGSLDTMAPGEKKLLPHDTVIARKQYRGSGDRHLTVSVVLMGMDRTSIHNPFICLRGQGLRVSERKTLPVGMAGREPLDITVLELKQVVTSPEGTVVGRHASYAYWFAGGEQETPSRARMLALMAFDRVFRNKAHRWAYVSILTDRREGSDAHIDEISGFVADLHPLVTRSE